MLRKYIKEGDTVIDIGAHTGDTTLPMALAAGRSGCTFALEPNPHVYKVLEENSTLNPNRTNIIPLNFAATETNGTFVFHYSDASYCNGGFLSRIQDQKHKHNYPLEVEGKNLEQFLRENYNELLQKLAYIKIDTEGYDKEVIQSIAGILLEFRPVMVTECLKRLAPTERHALYDTIKNVRYISYRYVEDSYALRGEQIERNDMMNWKKFDLLVIPEEKSDVLP